jgi:integrase
MSEGEVEDFFERLFKANDDRANLAFWCAKATINTTASGIELRGLRIKNVMLGDLDQMSRIYIPDDAVKNNSRPRDIVLNDDARFAFANLLLRANKLGATEPDHFLFPFRVNRKQWDPTRRAARGFLRKSWKRLKEVTGRKDLRPHMLRHPAITTMLEKGVDQSMAKAIAGHVTQKMLDYYSHIRAEAQAEAVARIGQSNVIQFAPSRRRRA